MSTSCQRSSGADPETSADRILEVLQNPVLVLDEQDVIRAANSASEELFGLSRDELFGHAWTRIADLSSYVSSSDSSATVAFIQTVRDGAGTPHRLLWQDSAGPDGTVVRVGFVLESAASETTSIAEVLAQAQRRIEEAEVLRRASSVVLEALDLQETIRRILEQLERVLPYDSASVQLLRDGELEIVGGRGWADPDTVLGLRFAIPGDNPNTQIVQERTPVVLGNAPDAYAEFRKPPHNHIRSFLGVPFVVRDRVIGVLAVDSKRPNWFSEDQIRVASAFADQVAIAIENAQLYNEVQELSVTDELTGLHNRRGFFQLGQRELDRARRFDHALSALMLDLDQFKPINDTYGHSVGDQVLAEIAARCRDTLRDVDLIARYGGEEFVVLLPETDLAEAERVAERLRSRVEKRAIATDAGELEIRVSIGVATWHPDMAELAELLERADQALYAAKRAGRNRIRRAPASA